LGLVDEPILLNLELTSCLILYYLYTLLTYHSIQHVLSLCLCIRYHLLINCAIRVENFFKIFNKGSLLWIFLVVVQRKGKLSAWVISEQQISGFYEHRNHFLGFVAAQVNHVQASYILLILVLYSKSYSLDFLPFPHLYYHQRFVISQGFQQFIFFV